VLRVLADRRRALGGDDTWMVAELHHLLLELIPGGAKKNCPRRRPGAAGQGPAAGRRGKARRRFAAELTADLERV
jgi:hypothetical protein